MLRSHVHQIETGLKATDGSGWTRFPQFAGRTGSVRSMGCHYSVLEPGCRPHPPHSHIEEELLLILDGDAEIILANSPEDPSPVVVPMTVGQFTYYPAWQHHTLRNVSARPVTYLMFKWRGSRRLLGLGRLLKSLAFQPPRLLTSAFDVRPLLESESAKDFSTSLIFEAPTDWFGRLHCHLTHVKPGGAYKPHADKYDVAIILLAGAIEVSGAILRDRGIAYFGRGEIHGMKNPGKEPATYLVFEFDRKMRKRKRLRQGDPLLKSHPLAVAEGQVDAPAGG